MIHGIFEIEVLLGVLESLHQSLWAVHCGKIKPLL